MEQGKILALDYGRRFIGLAISDISRQLVFGRGTLEIKPAKGLKPVFRAIAELCAQEKIHEIVIGLPLDEEGLETEQTILIRAFAKRLSKELSEVKISFEDESFSSFEADRLLVGSEISPSRKKDLQHELAASLILKKFLNIS